MLTEVLNIHEINVDRVVIDDYYSAVLDFKATLVFVIAKQDYSK